MIQMSNYRTLGSIFVLGISILDLLGCDPGSRSDRRSFIPANISMTIDNGSEATNDTVLRVSIRGDYISRMAVTTDSFFRGVEWTNFDSLIFLPIRAQEGRASVFGRFMAEGGGTTSVLKDDIEIDLSATIREFDVSAESDTLETGDLVTFEVETGESGLAEVTFGSYYSDLRLSEVSRGLFSRTIVIPGGIIDDSVISVAKFRDAVGNVAYEVASEHSLVIRGREIRPHLLGSLRISNMGGVACLVRGSVCFISDLNSKLHLVDVLSPSNPAYMRSIETSGWCGGMAANDRLLYLADGNAGVAIVGIFPANSASIIGASHEVSGAAADIELDGDYLYVSTDVSGLWVIDANDWIRPTVIAHLEIPGSGDMIIRHDNILFIAGTPSVACIDISNPRHPILLKEFAVEGDINDGIYYENKLFLATDTRGVVIYDVSDPSNPMLHSEHYEFVRATSITLMAPYIAIGRGTTITIVNGASPDILPVMGDVGGLRGIAGIEVFDNQLYVVGDGWFYTVGLYY